MTFDDFKEIVEDGSSNVQKYRSCFFNSSLATNHMNDDPLLSYLSK